jgi:hypothetical protein
MITITHKHSVEFSVFSFCILFAVVLGSASTAITPAYSSPEYGSYGSSNSTGNSAGGGSSTNAEGGSENSGYKDSSTKSGSGESTAPNDVTSKSSGNSNITGTTGGKLGGSLDSSTGSDSSVGNIRGGTEVNDRNSGESIIPNDKNNNQYNESSSNTASSTGSRIGTVREIAPGAPAGSHSLEYIQAFNTAAANPYKPGTKQYQNYQSGLKDAKKAGRDCDKMDTCGGPDLLGNYVNGVLHLSDKQYCGNGFGVYSTKLCKFREGDRSELLQTTK